MFASAPASIFTRTLAAAAASAILFTASVQASPIKTTETINGRTLRSIEVQFADLDLTTEEGAATLEARLKFASRQVCGTPNSVSLNERIAHRDCVNDAMAGSQRALVTVVARAEAGESFKPGERIAVGS